MEQAKCLEDGFIYTATNFSRLHPEELAKKRKLLQCIECSVHAFFRHASVNVRAACFGARPHAEGCSLAAQDYHRLEDDASDDFEALQIPSGKIIVDFSYGTPEIPSHDSDFRQATIFDHAARNYE